jgi:hypothetical protein
MLPVLILSNSAFALRKSTSYRKIRLKNLQTIRLRNHLFGRNGLLEICITEKKELDKKLKFTHE